MNEKKADAIDKMPFEAALSELERIVDELERGEVPLEKSIDIYERGERLKQRCETLLKEAEARIEKIVLKPGGKAAGVEPLDAEEM